MLRRVDNAHYWITNMDQAIAFYRDILGLDLKIRAGDDWAEFDVGGTIVALHGTRPGHAPPQGGATVVFDVEDLDATVRAMQLRGVRFEGEINEAPNGRFHSFRDPEGNLIQIFERAAIEGGEHGKA